MVLNRREARLPVTLNVRILGLDAMGKVFYETARTVDLSTSGARVTGLNARLQQGDIIGLQCSGEKCHVKVSWTSDDPDGTFQAGLHCVEEDTSAWLDKVQHSMGNKRHSVSGSVSLRAATCATPIWGTLHNISEDGCYVQSLNVAPIGAVVTGKFFVNDVPISGTAEVRSSHENFGMELQWLDLALREQKKLRNVLRSISWKHTEANSGKITALAQLERLYQLVVGLREGLESNDTLVDVEIIGRLSDAIEKLAAVQKSVQSVLK